jgi:epoxyqueuosine reductase
VCVETITAATVKRIARECGFELAGVARADPAEDFGRLERWAADGMAGDMRYLTDRRKDLRSDPRSLLASARSVICVGKLYNTAPEVKDPSISRYAWGSRDYHDVLREGLERIVERLTAISSQEGRSFEWKICVDTAPLLERTYARLAGLGWIGKNTCLINEPLGSWFFLGEILTSLDLHPDFAPPNRCGSCTRCIDACPTQALVPGGDAQDGKGWTLDARRCISYLTIELRGPVPEELRAGVGEHVFGCDICQEVCPWNSRAPVTEETAFAPREIPPLQDLARMTEEEFREFARGTPLTRPKYAGFARNVANALEQKPGTVYSNPDSFSKIGN